MWHITIISYRFYIYNKKLHDLPILLVFSRANGRVVFRAYSWNGLEGLILKGFGRV
jgi:hypothetical protein